MANKFFLVCMLLLLTRCSIFSKNEESSPDIQSTKVWDQAPHSAFTDLAMFNKKFYLIFREGMEHASNDGVIRILSSTTGDKFTSVIKFSDPDFDLRDPKMLNIGDSILYIQYCKADRANKIIKNGIRSSRNGTDWSDEKEFTDGNNWWLWGIEPIGKQLVSIGYNYNKPVCNNLFITSKLGSFKNIGKINGDINAGEASLACSKDSVYCAVRANHWSLPSWIGSASKTDLTTWSWVKHEPIILGGPKLFFLPNGKLYLITRSKVEGALRTAIYSVSRPSLEAKFLFCLPSGGDNSYAGIVVSGKQLFVSYYSTVDGKTAIYVAKVPMSTFN